MNSVTASLRLRRARRSLAPDPTVSPASGLPKRRRPRGRAPRRSRAWRLVAAGLALACGTALLLAPSSSQAAGERHARWSPIASGYPGVNLALIEGTSRHGVCATDRHRDPRIDGTSWTYSSSRTVGPGQPYVSNPATFALEPDALGAVEVVPGPAAATLAWLLDSGYTPSRLATMPQASPEVVSAAIYALATRTPSRAAQEKLGEAGRRFLAQIAPFVGPYTQPDPLIDVDGEGGARIRVAAPTSAQGRAIAGVAMTVRVQGARVGDTGSDVVTLTSAEEPAELEVTPTGATLTVEVTASGLPATTYEVWESPTLQDRFVTGEPTTVSATATATRPTPPPTPQPSSEVPSPEPSAEESEPSPEPEPSSQEESTTPTPTPPASPTPTPAPSTLPARPATTPPPLIETTVPRQPEPTRMRLAATGALPWRVGGLGCLLVGAGLSVSGARRPRRG